jgi:hypothetical protein
MASFLDISSVSPIIDELVQKLENDFQIKYRMNVSEIVKGGSLGHGTAVPGKFDLDLVLYSRGEYSHMCASYVNTILL